MEPNYQLKCTFCKYGTHCCSRRRKYTIYRNYVTNFSSIGTMIAYIIGSTIDIMAEYQLLSITKAERHQFYGSV